MVRRVVKVVSGTRAGRSKARECGTDVDKAIERSLERILFIFINALKTL
jgi:hypothetical protein